MLHQCPILNRTLKTLKRRQWRSTRIPMLPIISCSGSFQKMDRIIWKHPQNGCWKDIIFCAGRKTCKHEVQAAVEQQYLVILPVPVSVTWHCNDLWFCGGSPQGILKMQIWGYAHCDRLISKQTSLRHLDICSFVGVGKDTGQNFAR